MKSTRTATFRVLFCGLFVLSSGSDPTAASELAGLNIIPHRIEPVMKYRRPHDEHLGSRVQMFLRGPVTPGTFAGKTPAELLASGDWAWHDLQTVVSVPEEALTVWNWNGRTTRWGVDQSFELAAEGLPAQTLTLTCQKQWISSVTFHADQGVVPTRMTVYVANDSDSEIQLRSLRLWLPQDGGPWQALFPQDIHRCHVSIPAGEKGFVQISTGPLPLTYAAIEMDTTGGTLWSHLRIKPEFFDISAGWALGSPQMTAGKEGTWPFLDLLCHMHVNTAHFESAGGYSDNPVLYERYPLKRFHRLWPLETWDRDELLPQIHGVEFLGEPQYGGGRPVLPQEVFDKLLPYRGSRLATTVTHSEERIWRYYAGLSDFPHFDAYRVVAPAADSWRQYDRWNGQSISWGAPLETIGDLCRSQRDLNRPMPCAVWSQGPHDGWGGGFSLLRSGRSRRSPTPDELRVQALHALASRITSLYWFNLSYKSLMKFPDTWEPMTHIGREIRMLSPILLEGDAGTFERRTTEDGIPDWELSSIISPGTALLFAIDTRYTIDAEQKIFQFGQPRQAIFRWQLPLWLQNPQDVFRVDADGVYPVQWKTDGRNVIIEDTRSRDGIYLAAKNSAVRQGILDRHREALEQELKYPVNSAALEAIGGAAP